MTALHARRVATVLAVLVVLALALPLLRANAAARQQAWERDCVQHGGTITTEPKPALRNPLVVSTGHPVLECRSADGTVLARRD